MTAQSVSNRYPNRPITFVVPWPPGAMTSIMMAHYASRLEPLLGQPMHIKNIAGDDGLAAVRAAQPDGYTMLWVHDFIHGAFHTGKSTINHWHFDPVCLMNSTPSVTGCHARAPWKTLTEFIADARRRPGQLSFGGTVGSSSHMLPALIAREMNLDLKFVPYEGTVARMKGLMDGEIDLAEFHIPTGKEKIEYEGRVRMLSLAADDRHPAAPDVPTLKEYGINRSFQINRGVLAPKGVSPDVILALQEASRKVAQMEDYRAVNDSITTRINFMDHQQYAEWLARNDDEYAEACKLLGAS